MPASFIDPPMTPPAPRPIDPPTPTAAPGPPPPSLSEGSLAFYREQLDAARFRAEGPRASDFDRQAYVNLKSQVEGALAVTGQQLAPTDPRTPAQKAVDTAFGVPPINPRDYAIETPSGQDPAAKVSLSAAFSAMSLPPYIANPIGADILSAAEPVDPAAVKALVEASSDLSYDKAVAAVDQLLAGTSVKAASLSAFSLLHLAHFAQHRDRWSAARNRKP